jgi:hypothetical protein
MPYDPDMKKFLADMLGPEFSDESLTTGNGNGLSRREQKADFWMRALRKGAELDENGNLAAATWNTMIEKVGQHDPRSAQFLRHLHWYAHERDEHEDDPAFAKFVRDLNESYRSKL